MKLALLIWFILRINASELSIMSYIVNCGLKTMTYRVLHSTDGKIGVYPFGEKLNEETNNKYDCKALMEAGEVQDGVYTIYPFHMTSTPVPVYCDMTTDGGGWTVIHRRIDGNLSFLRDWMSYRNGFGDPNGEYWIGNMAISSLTNCNFSNLYVKVKDFNDDWKYAKYSYFGVESEIHMFKLHVHGYNGTAGDSLFKPRRVWHHNGMAFTTVDRDNDKRADKNCAKIYQGGWWYNDCYISNLNGPYCGDKNGSLCNTWYHYNNKYEGMEQSIMMIRRYSTKEIDDTF